MPFFFLDIALLRCGSCRDTIQHRDTYAEMLREAIRRGWVLRKNQYLCERCKKAPKRG